MQSYSINTKKSWSATQQDLAIEFERWGVTEWDTNYPRGARLEGYSQSETDRGVTLTYTLRGKQVTLSMNKQPRAVDNIRVLYKVIESLRLNELRGMNEVFEQAYLQLVAPVTEKTPWEVLGIYPGSPIEIAEASYKVKAKELHPDAGGSEADMKQLNQAIQKLREGNM